VEQQKVGKKVGMIA